MDHETARMDRFEQGVRAMSPQERDAMKAALKAIDALPPNCREMMLDRVTEIAAARGRAQARRTSDRITDLRRRTLVGARVPRALKEQCRARGPALRPPRALSPPLPRAEARSRQAVIPSPSQRTARDRLFSSPLGRR